MNMQIIRSSKLEELARAALAELANDGRGPFEKSCVIVSNPMRAQWLKRCALLDGMCGKRKVLANIEFRTLDRFAAEAAAAIRPHSEVDSGDMAICIYSLLTDLEFLQDERMEVPRKYLLKDSVVDVSRAFALAKEIASLFLKYQVWRPDMLRAWSSSGKNVQDSVDAVWQCALWGRLAESMVSAGESSAIDILGEVIDMEGSNRKDAVVRARQGYRSVILFDVPSIPERYMKFLEMLGEGGKVSEYCIDDAASTNGLTPAPGVELALHGCYTPRRELEAIRNGLYDWFDAGQRRDDGGKSVGASSHRPRTALVLCADFANYAPSVEAVFGADAERGEIKLTGVGSSIPVKVIGRTTRGAGALSETMGVLLNLPKSRFECSELMAILAQPAVSSRFGFDDGDRRFVREMVRAGNIRWGYDDTHVRQVLELPADSPRTFPFTWRRGVDRFLLGALEGEVGSGCFGVVDVGADKGVRPNAKIHGDQGRRAARLDAFLEAMNSLRLELPTPRTAEKWSDYLHGVVDDCFMRMDQRSAREITSIHRAVTVVAERLRRSPSKDSDVEYPFELVKNALMGEIESISLQAARQRTVANAVVFAPLSVGSAFPADMIWICGLNGSTFPRKSSLRAFDLMGQSPEPGDPSPRDEDRLAFREAVSCARSRLVLSYQYRNAKTNKEFPPSVLVEELRDRTGVLPVLEHRLHGFNARYFLPDSPLTSWSMEDYSAAEAAQSDHMIGDGASDITAFALPEGGTSPESPVEIELEDLIVYCQNPDKYITDRVLNARQISPGDSVYSDTEEFFFGQLDFDSTKGQWKLQEEIADLAKRSAEFGDADAECFLASMKEVGLLSDDYQDGAALKQLKKIWSDGDALRNNPNELLGGRTVLAALGDQGRNPDRVEVRTSVAAITGLRNGNEVTVHYRIVGHIPVVPGTVCHLQEALTGSAPPWVKFRLAIYGELIDRFGIDVKPFEVVLGEGPLRESALRLTDVFKDAPDYEYYLRSAFGLDSIAADEGEKEGSNE